MAAKYQCQCCDKWVSPPFNPKMMFPLLCWECSHDVVANLSSFCRRVCSSRDVTEDFKSKLKDYLDRKGLQGSILR